ncbi:DUF4238 domain-containing protein [Acinetobacter sp. ME22]|uniref:DUF4238 domain-containing protein n=1 Tax=Acinetobacter sp. ME22 TaxID=2904802 RepID=UPI001ED9D296|nr:DUF4238 domain-containing protein [Acinetobacter sp. ME22]MCG2572320.1 DUF4238 domain-containing protein [Acinetobacter sp. ME22]
MDKIKADTPKKQHYVPQFILRNFSFSKKHQIFAFNKSQVKKFITTVKDSASENGFYNLNIGGEKYTLEYKLSKLEARCGEVIKKICDDESIKNITDEDHQFLCIFVASLLLRVKKQREVINQLNTSMADWLKNMGIDPSSVGNFKLLEKEEIDKLHILFTDESVFDISDHLYRKHIVLLKAPSGASFMISDNPVVMYNYWPREFRGNKGVGLPGIEIQIPLSKKLSLSFICPVFISSLIKAVDSIKTCKSSNHKISDLDKLHAEILISSIKEGMAKKVSEKIVRFYNSLQIQDSLNYIYSDKDDFSLAEDMIKRNPDITNGRVILTDL